MSTKVYAEVEGVEGRYLAGGVEKIGRGLWIASAWFHGLQETKRAGSLEEAIDWVRSWFPGAEVQRGKEKKDLPPIDWVVCSMSEHQVYEAGYGEAPRLTDKGCKVVVLTDEKTILRGRAERWRYART